MWNGGKMENVKRIAPMKFISWEKKEVVFLDLIIHASTCALTSIVLDGVKKFLIKRLKFYKMSVFINMYIIKMIKMIWVGVLQLWQLKI